MTKWKDIKIFSPCDKQHTGGKKHTIDKIIILKKKSCDLYTITLVFKNELAGKMLY